MEDESCETEADDTAPEVSPSMVAVAAIIDKIVERGGRILSEKEHQRQIIHNAWEVTQEVACSRLQMCFVPHDEEQNSWLLDDEPLPPTKDIWGRKQIEVLKDIPAEVVREENKFDPRLRRRKTRAKAYLPGRIANRRQSLLQYKTRILPLSTSTNASDDRDHDDPLRHEWVQRFAQRLAQADAMKRWEEEELRREEQRRQQEMQVLKRENGEIETQSEDGSPDNAMSPEEMERLPKMNDSIHFDVKSCKVTPRNEVPPVPPSISVQDTSKADSHVTETAVRTDGFIRSELCQPSPLQTMSLEAGVVLECNGRRKAGPRRAPTQTAWKVYKGLAPKEALHLTPHPSTEEDLSFGIKDSTKDLSTLVPADDLGPQSYRREEPADWRSRLPSRPASAHASASRVPPATALHTAFEMLDQGRTGMPSVPKAQGLLAPPSKDTSTALPRCAGESRCSGGNVLVSVPLRSQPRNPRQKVALLGGTTGGAIVQPPLGATMGHGLLPSSEANLRDAAKKGEFFYPTTPSKAGEKPHRASSAASLSRTRSSHVVLQRSKATKTAWR